MLAREERGSLRVKQRWNIFTDNQGLNQGLELHLVANTWEKQIVIFQYLNLQWDAVWLKQFSEAGYKAGNSPVVYGRIETKACLSLRDPYN